MKYRKSFDINKIYDLYTEGFKNSSATRAKRPTVTGTVANNYDPTQVHTRQSIDGRIVLESDEIQMTIQEHWNDATDSEDPRVASLIIYGETGIGKTEIVEQAAFNIAKGERRIFVKFPDIVEDAEQVGPNQVLAQQVLSKPQDYFVFFDWQTGGLEASDVKGIPKMDDSKYMTFKKMEWAKYLVDTPALQGMIFLDELGHSTRDVQGQLFRLIKDRKLDDMQLIPNLTIVAATNLPDLRSGSDELVDPLVSRFEVTQFVPNVKKWAVWARNNRVHEYVIAFASKNPDEFFYIGAPPQGSRSFPSPRSVAMFGRWFAARDIENMRWKNYNYDENSLTPQDQKNYETGVRPYWIQQRDETDIDEELFAQKAYLKAATLCGPEWAEEWKIYYDELQGMDIDELLDNPKSITELDGYDFHVMCLKLIDKLHDEWQDEMDGSVPIEKSQSDEWQSRNIISQAHIPGAIKNDVMNKIARLLLPQYMGNDNRNTFMLRLYHRSQILSKLYTQYLIHGDLGVENISNYDMKKQYTGEQHATWLQQIKSTQTPIDITDMNKPSPSPDSLVKSWHTGLAQMIKR